MGNEYNEIQVIVIKFGPLVARRVHISLFIYR